MVYPENFSSIKISVASPERIRELSCGEVKKPDTIDYRTKKPVPDGLFAENIFGPVKDWECACGKYKYVPFRHLTCEKCGVELGPAIVRRERMGHIELAAPVCHTWYLKGESPVIGLVLGMSKETLELIIDFCAFVVLGRGRVADLRVGQVLTETEVSRLERKTRGYGGLSGLGVRLGRGAEAVRELLSRVNIGAECKKLRHILSRSPSGEVREAAAKRLRVLDAFRTGDLRPEWMVLTVLPVLPPGLRPVALTKEGRFAYSDVNDLYRRLIIRNNRLKKLMEDGADEEVIRNEKRMLQAAVDALMDNGARGEPVRVPSGRKLESLTSLIGGKRGTLRRNLSCKRVDYSGSSFVIADPELKLHECALPKEMALELFKPFVMNRLVDTGKALTISGAKRIVERRLHAVWKALEEAACGHPVLLVRPPAVQRGSILAFEPKLTDGDAVKISPLACAALDLDEGCDKLTVHVPLSVEAQAEARLLMLSSENILKPSDGEPLFLPTRDMVTGIYWLTLVRREDGKYYRREGERYVECEEGDEGAKLYRAKAYATEDEAALACEFGFVDIHDEIKVRRVADFEGERVSDLVKTTAGRMIFNREIPQDLGFVDRTARREVTMYEISVGNLAAVGGKKLAEIVDRCFKTGGASKAADVLDRIKTLGYMYATKAAVTVSVFDMTIPVEKYEICREAEDEVRKIGQMYRSGLMNKKERRAAVIETWERAEKDVTSALIRSFDRFNPIWIMEYSWGEGFREQLAPVSGMIGLLTGPQGRKSETAVKSSLREGLSSLEFFASARAGRRELAGTALRYTDAGYLTRKLVDAACDAVITEKDCASGGGKIPGISVEVLRDGDGKIIESLYDRIKGRFTSDDVKDAYGKILVPANTFIDGDMAQRIVDEGVERVSVRSPLTCGSRRGVCIMCYGLDFATNSPVEKGVAVGVVAALSLGEPCARLATNAFCTGGAATSLDAARCIRRIDELFEARKPANCAVLSEVSGEVEVVRSENESRVAIYDPVTYAVLGTYVFGPREELRVRTGDSVDAGTALSFGTPYPQDIMKISGLRSARDYIFYEIQSVYRSLGVEMNDRHVEVVLRQMLGKVRIEDVGSTPFIPGDTVDMFYAEKINAEAIARGKKPATAQRLLSGITKVALSTDSFLSAASLRDASGVLAYAAIKGGKDRLKGIKENVILGCRIPAGTGLGAYGDMSPEIRELAGCLSDDAVPGKAESGETDSEDATNGDDEILDPVFPDIDLSDGYTYTYADVPIEINKPDDKGKNGGGDS